MAGILLGFQTIAPVASSFQLNMPYLGFPTITHNEIRDLTTSLLTEVCNEVQI